jgi:hypothetical protein
MWNRDSLVSVVSLHRWPRRDWSFLWPCLRRALRPEPSLGPRHNNVIIPLDLTQLFCPGFMLAAGPPSGFTTDRVSWGGVLWRACNLTSFSPCLTGLEDYPFASRHKGPGFKSCGGWAKLGANSLVRSFVRSFCAKFKNKRTTFSVIMWCIINLKNNIYSL